MSFNTVHVQDPSVLSETVFNNIFLFSDENGNERRTLGAPVSLQSLFSILCETAFGHIFSDSNENENERRHLFVSYWHQLQRS
jgi:hypothetical protein